MSVNIFLYEPASFFQIFHNDIISIFHVFSLVEWYLFCEDTVLIERNGWIIRINNFILNTHFVIVFTKAWCAVDNTSTIRICNKVGRVNFEASVLSSISKEIKNRFILDSYKVFSFYFFDNFILLFSEKVFKPTFSENECFISFQVFNFNVNELRVNC